MTPSRLDLSVLGAAAISVSFLGALACSPVGEVDGGGDSTDGDAPGGDAGSAVDATTADARPPRACSDGPAVSFSSDVQPIFTASCNGTACHDGTGSAAQLDLTDGSAHDNLVGAAAFQCDRMLVVAGNLDDSYLVSKLTGLDMCSGTLMPKAGMSLPDPELDVVFAWICSGAADD